MAKIEKPQAVERLDAIVDFADALMVARGDLGVELPLERVPGIRSGSPAPRRAGKPVVVATQMLESMITAPVPTRAEVSDVATAVFEGADAIMLSAEIRLRRTYPVEAVATMDRIADRGGARPELHEHHARPADRAGGDRRRCDLGGGPPDRRNAEPCGDLLLYLVGINRHAGRAGAPADADRSRFRRSSTRSRRLSLVWGLHCVTGLEADNLEDMIRDACRIALREGFAKSDQRIIVTAGVPLGHTGVTNMLRVAFVEGGR